MLCPFRLGALKLDQLRIRMRRISTSALGLLRRSLTWRRIAAHAYLDPILRNLIELPRLLIRTAVNTCLLPQLPLINIVTARARLRRPFFSLSPLA